MTQWMRVRITTEKTMSIFFGAKVFNVMKFLKQAYTLLLKKIINFMEGFIMNLAQFPRRRYTEGFTPIEKLENFSKALGGPTIYIKRDDLLGLTSGGNKTR